MAVQFQYKARDSRGRIFQGAIEADSVRAAVEQLRAEGLFVSSVVAKRKGPSLRDLMLKGSLWEKRGHLPAMTLALFCRQLAVLVKTGTPIVDCLELLATQMKERRLQNALADIRADVMSGFSLTEAIRKFQHLFPEIVVYMVEVGEETGNLDETLDLLATYYEREYEVESKVKQALTYPGFIAATSIVAIMLLMFFVLPTFAGIFQGYGAQLPMATQLVLDLRHIMGRYWYLIFFSGLALVLGLRRYARSPRGKRQFDIFILKLPVIGKVAQKVIFSRFSRTLSLLVDGGVSMVAALHIAGKVAANVPISEAIARVRVGVERGLRIGSSLKQDDIFPLLFVQMLTVGEETGSMVETLQQVSAWYDREVELAVKQLTTLIEPLAIIAMTGFALFIAASVMLPLFQLVTVIQ